MLIVLISFWSVFSVAQSIDDGTEEYAVEGEATVKGGDNGVPWPFGLEQPFPWRGIQGLWQAEVDGWQRYFVLKTVGNSGTDRRLKVLEYDAVTCDLISQGTGFEQNRIVTAGMVGDEGRFLIQIRAFLEQDVKKVRNGSQATFAKPAKMVLAISKAAWNKPAARTTYSLTHLSSNPFMVCE
jgi:hypothetical protein